MAPRPYPSAYDKDLYKILRVHRRAETEVIHAAYKALLKLVAARTATDSDALAKELGEAHVILADSTDRRRYDDYRNEKRKLIGPYRILSKVAEGGFGTTYKAEHTRHGGLACIKHCSEISPHAEEILRQETRAIWDLAHYGLPVMRDFIDLEDGSCALAMSWVEGLTLAQVVEKFGHVDPENVAWITERMLNALWLLHDNGIIHGDIKPQNVIANDAKHHVVLVDFGLSLAKPTATTKSKGHTELFSPPEQMEGKTLVPGSDFFSLGMTMLYMLGGSYDAAARKDVPADLPDPMCAFIKKLIVRDVLNRPRNAGRLFEEFQLVRKASFGRTQSGMKKFAKQ